MIQQDKKESATGGAGREVSAPTPTPITKSRSMIGRGIISAPSSIAVDRTVMAQAPSVLLAVQTREDAAPVAAAPPAPPSIVSALMNLPTAGGDNYDAGPTVPEPAPVQAPAARFSVPPEFTAAHVPTKTLVIAGVVTLGLGVGLVALLHRVSP